MSKRDYYEVLNLSRGATADEIKRAYRRLAKEFHPDRNKGSADAEKRFKEVQEAYAVLSDPSKRDRYDRFGHAGIDPRAEAPQGARTTHEGRPVDIDDLSDLFNFEFIRGEGGGSSGGIFEELLRGSRGRGRQAAAAPGGSGRDLEHEIRLTFEQLFHGAKLDLRLEREDGQAGETIRITIPPGVRDGQRIRVRGRGEPGRRGRTAGDLYVVCRIQPHPHFDRREDDVYLEVPISLSEAGLGAKLDLPTPDGIRTVTVPPGTASGRRLRLAGLGVPNPRTGQRGDFYAVIRIVPPANPSEDQRRLLEQLARTESVSPRDGIWT